MAPHLERLLKHYQSFGTGPELEFVRALYRCLALEGRLSRKAEPPPAR